MLVEHRGDRPQIHEDAYVAPTAVVIGRVQIEAGARILHQAVVSAEDGSVRIGRDTVVMEHALIRARQSHPVRINSAVMVGPHTHINGCFVASGAFIATGASLFPGSHIGLRAEIRIRAVVQVNTRVPDDAVVPIGWIAVGDPASILPPDRHEEIWAIQRTLDFRGTVYGLGPDASMAQLMRLQSTYYGSHSSDAVI